ncbi:glycoside hydrolase family 15 protein [Streptomyces hoynatensis]|uniref:Glycoside hydrolase family 15 protein n=1 Tax=Streptomyces hoynatensis TaxID=1141874 RepID=A0A3A9Z1E3_9ACTN|nr:glycoside hydrolase family 15 protein [Streptomyces hoynatensis]RKN41187.1 glycoside hydrolase family 15 protein [Streptomyces hoynatensis]
MSNIPIEDYGLLSDRHSAALVGRTGAVDWLCFPRFDSPAVFAALLDDRAGTWSIRPVGPFEVRRRYLDGTMVLRTEFHTPSGVLALTDALDTGRCTQVHRLGAEAAHLLIRHVHATEGSVELAVEFRPRPEYGLVRPQFTEHEGGLFARGGADLLALSTPLAHRRDEEGMSARAALRAGEELSFGLHWGPLGGAPPGLHGAGELRRRLRDTVESWRAWSREHEGYRGPWQDLVRHSGRVLQALSYQPTGAIVAAVTTSLPEEPGGTRNWDYRYSWVRDAAFSMDALWVAACPDEADEFFAFMKDAAATSWTGSRLQIMYGIGGEHDLSERELAHLGGWRGSRPVRVGNGAWRQPQLDVYGELLDTAARFAEQLDAADPALRLFLPGLADAAAGAWDTEDHGIWEIRGEPRHFLYSKLMCWVALDRALALADRLDAGERIGDWERARERVRAEILERGWNEEVGAFTQSFGSSALDASALMLPITGFLPATDPRVLRTLDAVAEGLTDSRGLVARYRTGPGVDGLAGAEGSFLLCTFWLAQAQALAGRVAAARETFSRAAGHRNDLGLLAEQVDPRSGLLGGNFPQAFSHIGLVNAAWAIARAEDTARSA